MFWWGVRVVYKSSEGVGESAAVRQSCEVAGGEREVRSAA